MESAGRRDDDDDEIDAVTPPPREEEDEEEEDEEDEALSAAARRGVFARLARAVARRPASRLRPRGGGGGASRKLLGSGSGDCKSVVDRAYTTGTIKLNLAVVNDAARIALIGSVSSTNDDSVTVVNMAQALYDLLSDIKPTIVLTGQYDFSTDPYLYDSNNPSLIESFNAWQRANKASLPTHNVAHLFTGYDIGVHQGAFYRLVVLVSPTPSLDSLVSTFDRAAPRRRRFERPMNVAERASRGMMTHPPQVSPASPGERTWASCATRRITVPSTKSNLLRTR